MSDSKLHDLLGVKRDASEAEIEIKKAFKKLANRRNLYDHGGGRAGNPVRLTAEIVGDVFQGFEDNIVEHLFGGVGGMEGLFGGGSPFGHSHGGRGDRCRGEDTVFPLTVTLEDLCKGKTVKISIDKTILCPSCNGYGGKSGSASRCNPCRGHGIKVSLRPIGPGMMQQVQEKCQNCRGTGQDFSDTDRCKKCDGKQVSREKKVQEIVVDKGKRHGDKVVLRGAGDQKVPSDEWETTAVEPLITDDAVQPNVEPGDLVVVLQMVKIHTFDRDGNHLLTKMNIDLVDAHCGMSKPLKHLDGRT
ncbi:putative DnaJ-like protein subfamily A member 2 [Hypsibius exemplaris]|uniref:DnaJ-like protein subfamily A member 2 n=1 Tax=Hypsibius exemplaris TaxID=2072580 RepID=A0A1W0X227_HYPEX|nr:putative DnaJ-like protein subfamily A member 2 [Hypsibius exemplaris]